MGYYLPLVGRWQPPMKTGLKKEISTRIWI